MKGIKRFASVLCVLALMGSLLSVTAWADDQNVSLQINGENLILTDARPEFKAGRTFIPARIAFEALGAAVDWEQSTKSVIAVKDDITVVMSLGSTTAEVTKNGETKEVQMDVAPYSKGGRTYVPVRFAAEALNCVVGWDGSNHTVIIVDLDALLGDATCENLNGWMAAEAKQEQIDNALTTGSATLKLTVPDDAGVSKTYPLKVDFRSHATQTKQQLELSTDFKDLARLLLEGSDLTTAERNEFLKLCKAAMEARMDLSTGKIYFTVDCPLLLELTEEAIGSGDIWYLTDINALLDEAGMSGDLMTYVQEVQSQVTGDMTFEELLYMILKLSEPDDANYSYDTMKLLVDLYCDILSDQAMVKSGNNYIVESTLEEEGAAFLLKMTYQTKGDRLVGVTVDMRLEDGYNDPVTMTMKVLEDGANASITLNLDAGDGIKIDFALSAKTVKATTEPAVEPPAGAQIVDVMEELNDATPWEDSLLTA